MNKSPTTDATAINRALRQFRKETQSTSHKRQLRNFLRTASKSLKGCLAYVDHLFEHHSRLLVVRKVALLMPCSRHSSRTVALLQHFLPDATPKVVKANWQCSKYAIDYYGERYCLSCPTEDFSQPTAATI